MEMTIEGRGMVGSPQHPQWYSAVQLLVAIATYMLAQGWCTSDWKKNPVTDSYVFEAYSIMGVIHYDRRQHMGGVYFFGLSSDALHSIHLYEDATVYGNVNTCFETSNGC